MMRDDKGMRMLLKNKSLSLERFRNMWPTFCRHQDIVGEIGSDEKDRSTDG